MDESKDKEPVKCEVDCKEGFQDYGSMCSELEERSKKAEERCRVLELQIEKKKSEYELLEAKFKALEVEKFAMEDEVKVLKSRNAELEGRIARIEDENKVGCARERLMERVVDLTEENEEADAVVQLMIENKVLECEKKRAEHEVEVWKEKFRELESRVVHLEKESLILRGGQYPLGGKREEELGLPDMGSHQGTETKGTSEMSKPKDGSFVRISPDHVQTQKKTMDLDETICASPVKGIGHLQAAGTPSIDTPYKHSIHVKGEKRGTHLETEVVCGSRVRKQLAYGDEGSPYKKMAPSTPGGGRRASVGIIDISDSDDEPDITHIHLPTPEINGNKMVCVPTDRALGGAVGNEKVMTYENSLKRALSDRSDEEETSRCKGNLPFSTTPKRKRASNIVTSDSESDDDDKVPICKLKKKHLQESTHDPTDSHLNSCSTATVSGVNLVPESLTLPTPKRKRASNIVTSDIESDDDDKVPICKLKKKHLQESIHNPTDSNLNSCSTATVSGVNVVTESLTPHRRRLVTLRQCVETGGTERNSPSNLRASETKYRPGIPTTEGVEDDESEEVGSDSEGESLGGFIVDSSDESDGNLASSESEDISDGNVDFGEILSIFRRNRDQNSKWEFEADMLAAFGKDPELCMKAVCALYRQQTTDEKSVKGTLHSNQRGFSQCDALRGTTLAEFLTDGDPQGDLKKSVKELQEYHPKALELCRTLATHYSKQLFAIYNNKEDPYFLPS